jgi:hypothetical protein
MLKRDKVLHTAAQAAKAQGSRGSKDVSTVLSCTIRGTNYATIARASSRLLGHPSRHAHKHHAAV